MISKIKIKVKIKTYLISTYITITNFHLKVVPFELLQCIYYYNNTEVFDLFFLIS